MINHYKFLRKTSVIITFLGLTVLYSCNRPATDVTLNEVTQDAEGIQINWSASDDDKFESYKLYKHNSSGIDELNGELIHVATSSDEVEFTDINFDPLSTYYYRVYVENNKGISSGSNIESITTETISIVRNGNFESGESEPTEWTIIENNISEPLNNIELDPAMASEGSKSLKFHHNNASGCWEMWIQQYINLSDLTPGGTYQLSFDYRSNETITTDGIGVQIKNSDFTITIPIETFSGGDVWYNQTTSFTLPDYLGGTDPILRVHFCVSGVLDWWIDDFQIIKV